MPIDLVGQLCASRTQNRSYCRYVRDNGRVMNMNTDGVGASAYGGGTFVCRLGVREQLRSKVSSSITQPLLSHARTMRGGAGRTFGLGLSAC